MLYQPSVPCVPRFACARCEPRGFATSPRDARSNSHSCRLGAAPRVSVADLRPRAAPTRCVSGLPNHRDAKRGGTATVGVIVGHPLPYDRPAPRRESGNRFAIDDFGPDAQGARRDDTSRLVDMLTAHNNRKGSSFTPEHRDAPSLSLRSAGKQGV
jgi:hypothetical protein